MTGYKKFTTTTATTAATTTTTTTTTTTPPPPPPPPPPRGGGTLGISGWGCAAGTLEPLTYTRASSTEFCYPILE